MLQVVGLNPGGAWPGCKMCCVWKCREHCFCSRCRIFRAHLSWIRNLFVPFHLNFCSVLNFWTYMFFLCTLCFCHFALPAMRRPTPLCFAGLAPALLLAAIFRGRARRARPLLLLYVLLLLLLLLLLFFFSSNGSLWQPYERNMGKWWNLAHS